MFVAKSEYLQKIKNIASMAKELKINIYIWGEKGVGKTFLANYISPSPSYIIENFDKHPFLQNNYPILIATGTKPLSKEIMDKYFAMDIELKPLKEHPEDIEEFVKFFTKEAQKTLKIQKEPNILYPDISENLNSLKRQIYKELLKPQTKEEIYEILKEIFLKEHSSYEEEIREFEKTLFEAMKEKYKSKLKISEKLKMNRVTLTKKMKALDV